MKIYAPAARRFYAPQSVQLDYLAGLSPLLGVLEEDPTIRNVAEHLTSLCAVLEGWSSHHGMAVSRWEFGYAAVRATARHPLGGVAVIEALVDSPPDVEVLVCHWIDDHVIGTRRSWGRRATLHSPSQTELLRAFDEAVAALLAPPDAASYSINAMEVDPGVGDPDKDYWATFQILH